MVMTNTNKVISFEKATKKVEADRLVAAVLSVQQQDWFVATDSRLKKKRNCILLLFVFDLFLAVIALLI